MLLRFLNSARKTCRVPAWAFVALLSVPLMAVFADDAPEPGFTSLFNGKDLSGWDGDPKFWSVQEGAITGKRTKDNPGKENTFLIWKDGTVDNFELRAQYRIVGVGGNSGVQYRSRHLGNWVVAGYQADIDAEDKYSGNTHEEKGRAFLAHRGQKTEIGPDGKVRVVASLGDGNDIQKSIRKEDWNDYTVIAQGNELTHIINGRVTSQVTDNQPEKRAFSGILALQLHAGPPMTVQFRNLRIRRLTPGAAPKNQ